MLDTKTTNSGYEAVFAAAAHTLTAGRHYEDAALVLRACSRLTGPDDPPTSLVDKLNVVRGLCAQLFSRDIALMVSGTCRHPR